MVAVRVARLGLLAAVATVAVAVAAEASSVVEERSLTYTLFVKHDAARVQELYRQLLDVSNPDSAQYGKFLTQQQVLDLQKPSEPHRRAVADHLSKLSSSERDVQVRDLTPAGDKVEVKVSRSFFDALPADQPGGKWAALFPRAVEEACDFIGGGDSGREHGAPASRARLSALFAQAMKPKTAAAKEGILRARRAAMLAQQRNSAELSPEANPQACLAQQVTPPCLRKAYGLNATTVGGKAKRNHQIVAVNEYYSPADLEAFLQQYNAPAQKVVANIAGKNNPGQAGTEASLDVQYIITAGRLVPTSWVYLNQNDPNPFTSWLTWAANCSDSDLPLLHSLSVGVPENEFETLGPTAIPRMNQEMAALGARGATLVFASGDAGYPGKYQNFPASSWCVLSTGGVWNGGLGYTPLSVDPISTGGFSGIDANPIQTWQVPHVSHWEHDTKGQRPASYNASHRCVPDVATFDTQYEVMVGGMTTPVGGTSCAAPTTSGMLSMINEALLLKNLPPLGMVAPFLYKNVKLLRDITMGNNNGIAATVGYDPASGLGSWHVDSIGDLIHVATASKSALPHRWE